MYYVIILIYCQYIIRDRRKGGRKGLSLLIIHKAAQAFTHFNIKYSVLFVTLTKLIYNVWFCIVTYKLLHKLHRTIFLKSPFNINNVTNLKCKCFGGVSLVFHFSVFQSTLLPKLCFETKQLFLAAAKRTLSCHFAAKHRKFNGGCDFIAGYGHGFSLFKCLLSVLIF